VGHGPRHRPGLPLSSPAGERAHAAAARRVGRQGGAPAGAV